MPFSSPNSSRLIRLGPGCAIVAVPWAAWMSSIAWSGRDVEPGDRGRLAVAEEAGEGLLRRGADTGLDEPARKVGAGEVTVASDGLHGLHRHREAEGFHLVDHERHALLAEGLELDVEVREPGDGAVDEVPEDVHLAPVEVRRDLNARHQPQAELRGGCLTRRQARDGVVISDGQDGDPSLRRARDLFVGRVLPVARGRVRVEVDHAALVAGPHRIGHRRSHPSRVRAN
jgi:hypothetical protein